MENVFSMIVAALSLVFMKNGSNEISVKALSIFETEVIKILPISEINKWNTLAMAIISLKGVNYTAYSYEYL